MTDEDRERKPLLLRASRATFADTATRVTAELRKGPRGSGWDMLDHAWKLEDRDLTSDPA